MPSMLRKLTDIINRKPAKLVKAKTRCVDKDNNPSPYHSLDISEIKKIHLYILNKYLEYQHDKLIVEIRPKKRFAIIVPFRHREQHLEIFVPYMTQYFKDNNIEADIYIIHQADDKLFNKGALLNIGYTINKDDYDYFCFHDIDLIPHNSSYIFTNHPTGLIHHGYPVGYFGGVILFTREQYAKINGFSNQYWNWGWEDVDLRDRCFLAGLPPIMLTNSDYELLPHRPSTIQTPDGKYHDDKKTLKVLNNIRRLNRKRYVSFSKGKSDFLNDGLNTLKYEEIGRFPSEGFTRIDVKL